MNDEEGAGGSSKSNSITSEHSLQSTGISASSQGSSTNSLPKVKNFAQFRSIMADCGQFCSILPNSSQFCPKVLKNAYFYDSNFETQRNEFFLESIKNVPVAFVLAV